jgi:predicted Zn-dependent protease
MAYTVDQLTALEAALASGHLEVQYADKKIKYQDTSAMMKLATQIRAELISAGVIAKPSSARNSISVASFSRD